MPEKTRKIIIAIAGVTVAVALIAILALSLGKNTDYATLFTGLNQSEAQEVANLLQDQGVTYQYNESSGAIRVPAATVEQTGDDELRVVFDEPQRAAAPGQAVVLYHGDVVVGGGTIC